MPGKKQRNLATALGRLPKARLVGLVKELASTVDGVLPRIENVRVEDRPPQAAALVRRRLAGLRGATHYYRGFDGAAQFSTELDQILDAIERGVLPRAPAAALDLLVAFIECDACAFERADDSYGHIGGVFSRACALFGAVARKCPSPKVIPLLRRLWADDGYGARGDLIKATTPALGAAAQAELIAGFRRQLVDSEVRVTQRAVLALMDIADVVRDPALYEAACLHGSRATVPVFRLHVAQRYLQAGRAAEALARMPARAEECGGYAHDWTQTHIELLRALGRTDDLREALWAQFVQAPDKAALESWLASAPAAGHTAMRERARAEVLKGHHSPARQGSFFLELDDTRTAAHCVLKRAAALDGSAYHQFAPIAQALAATQPLAASAVYRALLDANLRQAKAKYYYHGVRYWRALESLAARIAEWSPLVSHADYVADVRARHIRKVAFWAILKVQMPDNNGGG